MNLTRERIRQVEVKALAKLEALRDMMELRDFIDEGPVGKRRLPVIAPPPEDDEEDEVEAEADDAEVVASDKRAPVPAVIEEAVDFDGAE